MFENVLGQKATAQLILDMEAGLLAQTMLFSGPPASGKGTTALELGRIISCEAESSGTPGRASWNCSCTACTRHRFLVHPDLLCMGPRSFCAEIAASSETFLRNAGNPSCHVLFVRSVRKLLARFNPVLWEDDPKSSKMSPLASSLEEELDELDLLVSGETEEGGGIDRDALSRLVEGILKNVFKLESEGIGETIPIAQLRRAAWWSRLAPLGRSKILIIENADRMQDEGRNSLLKILEEPPGRVFIMLTTPRPGSLLPTMLSRLRLYRFYSREAEVEEEVIKRVYRDHDYLLLPKSLPGEGEEAQNLIRRNRISEYLDSFLPVSGDTLESLAAYFAASVAYNAALLSKKLGRQIPDEVVLLGKSSAPKAEAAGLGRPSRKSGAVIACITEKAGGFEIRSLFSRFLFFLLEQVSLGLKPAHPSFLPRPVYNEIWTKCSAWADTAVGVYKLRPAQAMEKLFADLSRELSEL